MSGFWPIYKREVKALFQSASTYIALGLLFLIIGAIYHQVIVLFVEDSVKAATGGPFTSMEPPNVTIEIIENIFTLMSAMLLFIIPILTMRMMAAERSTGTLEVLVTCPVSDWGIILGKYFALVTVGALLVTLTVIYPITTYFIGRNQGAMPEWPVVISCSVGLMLIFCTYAAFGLMASSFTQSQVTASVITLIGLLIWVTLGEYKFSQPFVERILNELAPSQHVRPFIGGLLSLKDMVFFILASYFFLFTAVRTLEARKWRV